MTKLMELIQKTKAALVIDQPFFASMILPMPIIEDTGVETFETDGESIWFSPEFASSLTRDELTFVFAHEVLHGVLDHFGRLMAFDPQDWNKAADYIVNGLLVSEKIGVMPKGGLHDPSLVAKGGGTAEGVYRLIQKQKPKPDKKGKPKPQGHGNGGALDKMRIPGSKKDAKGNDVAPDPATASQKAAELQVRIQQARNAAKAAGKLSSGLDRLIGELIKTKVDWRKILRDFLTEKAKIDFSFAKPKRRFLADDLYLPSMIGNNLGLIAVAVDCSGSVDQKTLGIFSGEINGIFEDGKPTEVRIIYFDSKVLPPVESATEFPIELKARGGGGTAFSPIFEEIDAWENAPSALVVLTDLYCNDFGGAPNYPVLWASTHKDSAPFGEVIKIETEGN